MRKPLKYFYDGKGWIAKYFERNDNYGNVLCSTLAILNCKKMMDTVAEGVTLEQDVDFNELPDGVYLSNRIENVFDKGTSIIFFDKKADCCISPLEK